MEHSVSIPTGMSFDKNDKGQTRHEDREGAKPFAAFISSQVAFYILALLPLLFTAGVFIARPLHTSAFFVFMVAPVILKWLLYDNMRVFRPLKAEDATDKAVQQNVLVVGAGVSGIVACKELTAEGHTVTCLDALDDIGGIFYYQPAKGGVWNSAHLTSSPFVTAFSDFPPENHSHWHHSEYHAYLKRYVQHFNIQHCFQLKTRVTKVKQLAGWMEQPGKWEVTFVVDNDWANPQTRIYDAVVVSSGLNQEPNIPKVFKQDFMAADGQEKQFSGLVMHACQYKNEKMFEGKRVLVVGLGETGSDLTKEISSVAASVDLSCRRGTFVIPRINPLTKVNNDYDTNRLRYSAPIGVRDALIDLREHLAYWTGNLDAAGKITFDLYKKSKAGAMSQFACKSARFVDAVLAGKASIKPEVTELTSNGVKFDDGTMADYDVIVLCTGFVGKVDHFVELLDDEPIPCMSHMFKKMYIPQVGPSLAFIGYARPSIGSIPPIAELQTRLHALVLSGKRKLPELDAMRKVIDLDREQHGVNFAQDGNRPTLVHWIHFMDQLAEMIGCRPDPLQLLREPMVLWQVLTSAMCPVHYRFSGPGANPKLARDTMGKLQRGMPLADLAIWTASAATVSVLRGWGLVRGEHWRQQSTML